MQGNGRRKELIDRLAGTNRSDYMRRCLLAGSGGRIGGLSQVTEQINEVNRRLDILFDRIRDRHERVFLGAKRSGQAAVTTQVAASRSDDAARIHGNRDGDPAAFDGDPGQYEICPGELERNGYKVWESKQERTE